MSATASGSVSAGSSKREPKGEDVGTGDDEELIRVRLLPKEFQMKRITKKTLAFINSITRSNSYSESYAVYQGLVKELAMFEFQLINKLSLVVDTNESQIQQYVQLQNHREKEIQEAEKEIERLKRRTERRAKT